MSNMRKRIIGVAIAALMLIVCPIAVFATEAGQAGDVAVNSATEVTYDNVSDALSEAKTGETIVLKDDAEATIVSVTEDVTLDLNGHVLAASYVTCFGNIVDKSEQSAGLLKVNADRFLIQNSNAQLPVKGTDGYKFVDVAKFNKSYQEEQARYVFQPFIAKGGHDLIKQGKDASGVTVNVRVSWMQENGKRSQNFVYNDSMVSQFLESYGENGKYSKMFILTLAGTQDIEELTFEAVVVSDTGVEFVSEPTVIENKVDDDNTGDGTEGEGPLDPGTPEDPNEPGNDDIENKPDNPGDNTGGEGNEGDDTDDPTVDFPEDEDGKISGDVSVDDNNLVEEDVELSKLGQSISATVPAGVKLEEGTTKLTLTVKEKNDSDSDVETEEDEVLKPFDVHIEGVAADNTKPIIINMGEIMPIGMNIGNYTFYHVEGDETKEMKAVASVEELNAHNQFYYDPATGNVTVCMTTFSEVALVANEVNPWNGEFDYTWYTNAVATADEESATEYTIANADQLAAFGAIVGGMDGQTKDDFEGDTVKLIADINLGYGVEGHTYSVFYPIGYYNNTGNYKKTDGKVTVEGTEVAVTSNVSSFSGIFDGNGHTISNFYQNTWEMFGDYNDGYSGTPNHYKDAMGLFGYVVNGTVTNLIVDNFSSDGEFTPTGVIAAYAVNSTFENIAITNCNPRVYNTGNGGIVGIGGNTNDEASLKLTFENITIDNTNKITALWGSWDVACGGLIGMFRGAGLVDMTNCHVAAQIDVYNDVCGNYQYYWYRYSGMMIGTNKNMTTSADGKYTIPETGKFTTKDCTVDFGDWNNYYYCELVDNSLASYTHDHQFSRLTQVDGVDVENKTVTVGDKTTAVPASGRVNYVVIKDKAKAASTDNAECYHFVNGVVHNHADKGTETVDGVEGVLKEDKQHVFLPFNQLVTGYGWGVQHVPISGDSTASEIKYAEESFTKGITILGPEANSIDKFDIVDENNNSFESGTTVAVGELFKAKSDLTHPIDTDNVNVTVSPVGNESTAGGTYVPAAANDNGEANWTEGTLTFTGTGDAQIIITDYHFCKRTVFDVKITEKQAAEKFDVAFDYDPNTEGNQNNIDKYLYRVGNIGTVALGTLFEADKVTGDVNVTVKAIDGTDVSGTYANNSSDWTKGTIQFSGTGIVEVTINDADPYCEPTVLHLEVVNAKNITSKSDATADDVVLLNNISGGFTVSNGHTFHGNGFKITCSGDGSYRSAALSYGFVTVENGGVLDNVQIVCDIFPESYLYTSEMEAGTDGRYPYGYSAIVASGNSTISNSYIYGARNNILVTTGNVTIENTVTECGSLSNIQIKSTDAYTVTLDDVTTIQYKTTSKYDESKTVYGFGVVVGEPESVSNPKIKITGDLKQYNWITDNNVSNSYARVAIQEALAVEDYQHTIDDKTAINTGIAYLNSKEVNIEDERENFDVIPYQQSNIKMQGYTGSVYSISGYNDINAESRFDATTDKVIPYVAQNNRPINPTIEFNGSNNALNFTSEYNNTEGRWFSELSVDLDNIDGGSYAFKFSDLTVKKYGKELDFTVKDIDGNAVDKNDPITLNQLSSNEYTLVITDDWIYDANGAKSGDTRTINSPFKLSATKTSIEPPKFTNAGTATAIRLVTSSGGEWRPAYTALTGVSVTYWSDSESKVKTVDLSTLYNSGNISSNVWTYTCDDYTLTITGGAVHTDGTTITPVVAAGTLYFASTNKTFGTGTTSRDIKLTYVFTDKNDSTTWNRTETVTYSELSEYDYNSFKNNGTLTAPSSGGGSCLAEGTMITMSDGEKRAVENLRKGDSVMAFDHITGKIVSKDVIIVVKTQSELYKNTFVFDDGTKLPTINEHGIYDLNLDQYVNIDHVNADEYIGHEFVAVDAEGNIGTKKLVDVEVVYQKSGYKYDIVTEGTLNYVAEDTLSVTHVLVDIINTFEFDENMIYDSEKMQADIEEYGLYEYDEWKTYADKTVFDQYNIPIMKVGVSKGIYTKDYIIYLINTYVLDESVQI